MKKVLSAFILLFAAAVSAFGGAKKIDASSNEKLQETFFEALTAI